MTPKRPLLSQKGFSLIEILMTVGLTGLVLATASISLIQHKFIQRQIEINHTVESETALVRLGLLSKDGVTKALPENQKQFVLNCLGGSGEQCLSLNQRRFATDPENKMLNDYITFASQVCITGQEPGCLFSKQTSYFLNCEADHRCHKIEFVVELEPLSQKFGALSPRTFSVPLSDRYIQARSQMDFSCTDEGLASGTQFDRLFGECIIPERPVEYKLISASAFEYNQPDDFAPIELTYEFSGQNRTIQTTFCDENAARCATNQTYVEIYCSEGFEAAIIGGSKIDGGVGNSDCLTQ